jgi:hypothetical protein
MAGEPLHFIGTLQNGPLSEQRLLADAISAQTVEWTVDLAAARIGRLDAAMVDCHGSLIVVGQTYAHLPETRALIDGINTRGEKWGLVPGRPGHVGITQCPEGGCWLHAGARSMRGLLPELRRCMDEPGMYVPRAMRGLIIIETQ